MEPTLRTDTPTKPLLPRVIKRGGGMIRLQVPGESCERCGAERLKLYQVPSFKAVLCKSCKRILLQLNTPS